VGWARLHQDQPYRVSYQWINVTPSFNGATQFQVFAIDVSLRADHLALAAIAAILLLALAVVSWHRAAGRGEPGPARFHALILLAVLGGVGTVVSGDLAALTAWWGVAGVATGRRPPAAPRVSASRCPSPATWPCSAGWLCSTRGSAPTTSTG